MFTEDSLCAEHCYVLSTSHVFNPHNPEVGFTWFLSLFTNKKTEGGRISLA